MVHRVFRLAIRPERAPEVCRVVDFDGRSTLHDVHDTIQRELELDDDHLYAFYLSGKYFDRSSEHSLSPESFRNSSRSALFRLELRVGQKLAYLFDFGDELRHEITVVSIADVEAPLDEPVLVESVGTAPLQYSRDDEEDEPYQLPEHLTELTPIAEAVLTLSERLDELCEEEDAKRDAEGDNATLADAPVPEAIVSLVGELAHAALELAGKLAEDEAALHELDLWSRERELLARLLELPTALLNVRKVDSALAVARAFAFGAGEQCNADIAVILAESGQRDQAIAQLESNLRQHPESCFTAIKSGEALEALGEPAEAEASYRRAVTLADDETEGEQALIQLVGLLEDMGRSDEADALLASAIGSQEPVGPQALPRIGRNDPCPCASGKKYKRCHGA
jgi:hypothetical protein